MSALLWSLSLGHDVQRVFHLIVVDDTFQDVLCFYGGFPGEPWSAQNKMKGVSVGDR